MLHEKLIWLCDKELQDVHNLFLHKKVWKEISGGADREKFTVPHSYEYLLFYSGNELACIFYFRPWNKQVLESHIVIHPDYRHTTRKKKLMERFHEWAKEKDYLSIVCQVPAGREKVIKFIQEHNYKAAGMIEDGISWDHVLMPLLLFTHKL